MGLLGALSTGSSRFHWSSVRTIGYGMFRTGTTGVSRDRDASPTSPGAGCGINRIGRRVEVSRVRHSPVWQSILSRMMSACPLWRANSLTSLASHRMLRRPLTFRQRHAPSRRESDSSHVRSRSSSHPRSASVGAEATTQNPVSSPQIMSTEAPR